MKKQTDIDTVQKERKAYSLFIKKYLEIINDTRNRIINELCAENFAHMNAENKGYILRHSHNLLSQCEQIAQTMVHVHNGTWQHWAKNFRLSPNEIYVLTCVINGKKLEEIARELITSKQVISNYISRIRDKFVDKIVENNMVEKFNSTYPEYKITCNKKTHTMRNFQKWILQEIQSEIESESEIGLLLLPKID